MHIVATANNKLKPLLAFLKLALAHVARNTLYHCTEYHLFTCNGQLLLIYIASDDMRI